MTAATKPASKGLITVRSRDLLILAPGIMGFENLIKPDEYEGALSFKVQAHHNEQQVERITQQIAEHVIEANWGAFLKEAEKSQAAEPRGGWVKPDAGEWVADHLKDPSERSKTQLPWLSWKNAAEYRDKKTGEMKRKVMRAYDPKNNILDLPALKLGMGSTIQPVLQGGLYKSPLIKQPAPSFKLQGVRVLKLVQFGGGGGQMQDVSRDDMVGLEEGFDADDLGSYAKKADEAPAADTSRATQRDDFGDDFSDDEIPF